MIAPVKKIIMKQESIEALSKILGDTHTGLTGGEIGHILVKCRIPDIEPHSTKWRRLFNAFAIHQNKRLDSNHIIAFIHKAMKPVSHTKIHEYYEGKREELNTILAFEGLHLHEDGNIRKIKKAATITEAEKRANKLKAKLKTRNVHDDVLKFCRAELLQDNYFHAVLEATKSVANKIRALSGLRSDGAKLAQEAFSLGKDKSPILAINALSNETEEGEQRAFVNLLTGLFGMFRNPTAHAEKICWPISEEDALDILSMLSLVHRKLDYALKME